MTNKETITIEFKADTDNFNKKIQEIFNISTNALSNVASTIMQLSKEHSKLKNVEDFFKEANQMIGQFSTSFEESIKNGVYGFERFQKVIKDTTQKTKLASAASEAFKFALSPIGLTLITVGITAIGVAIYNMSKKESDAIKAAKEHTQVLKDQKTQWDQMQKSSKDSYDSNMSQVELTKRYSKELLTLVDNNGMVKESQEKVNFLLEQLNSLLPDAGFHIDEETGKIVDMNGETVNLTESLGELIEAQKAQAYLDAYKSDYEEAVKNKSKLMEEQLALYEEISQKQSIWDQYVQRSKEAMNLYGNDVDMYGKYMREFYEEIGMTESEIRSMKGELDILQEGYEANSERLKGYTEQVKDFDEMQEALINKDWDKVRRIMNDIGEMQLFDPMKGDSQIKMLQQQYDELNNTKKLLEEMKSNGEIIDEEYLQSITEQTNAAKEELTKAEDFFTDKRHNYFSEEANLLGDEFKESIVEKTSEAGSEMVDQIRTDAQTGIDEINATIASTTINPIVIPVIYQYPNASPSLGATMTMVGASYDDSVEEGSSFQPFASGISPFMAEVKETLRSVQSRVTSGILSMPAFETKLVGVGGKQIEISQVNNFNVPLQKPSDVSKEIARINRELAKKL